jgi:hypothetical protein
LDQREIRDNTTDLKKIVEVDFPFKFAIFINRDDIAGTVAFVTQEQSALS